MFADWWLKPPLILSVILAVGYGTLFHLWQGRTYRDLIVYVLAAGVGFALGQGIGMLLNSDWFRIGQVRIIEATLTAWFALLITHAKPNPPA